MTFTRREKAERARARDLLVYIRRITRERGYRAIDRLTLWSNSNPNPEIKVASLNAIDALHALLKGAPTVERIDKVRELLSTLKAARTIQTP
jgi:hypothetical protein